MHIWLRKSASIAVCYLSRVECRRADCLAVTLIEDFSKDCLGSRRGIRPRPVRCLHSISVFPTSKTLLSRLRYGLFWLRFFRFGFSKLKLEHCSSKGVLEKKKRPSKWEKSRASWTWFSLHRHCHLESFFVCFFVFFLFFFYPLFLFLSSSSPTCYAPYVSSTGTQPDKYCFTFSAILFECTLRAGRHRVLAARSADPSRTLLRLRCNRSCSASFR